MQFAFKVTTDNKRSGKHPDSDGLEIYYRIQMPGTMPPPPPVVTNDPSPDNPDGTGDNNGLPSHNYQYAFKTRARFTHQFALTDIGKLLHVYARWVNTNDGQKNGPFSMVSTRVIS